MEADANPLPSDDTTPPVTKMYFVATSSLLPGPKPVSHILDFVVSIAGRAVEPAVAEVLQHLRHRRPAAHTELDHVITAQLGPHAPRAVQPPFERHVHPGIAAEPQCGQLQLPPLAQESRPRGARGRGGQARADLAS